MLEMEPVLSVKAVGTGGVRGSGMKQGKCALEVVGMVKDGAGLITCAMWCTVDPII